MVYDGDIALRDSVFEDERAKAFIDWDGIATSVAGIPVAYVYWSGWDLALVELVWIGASVLLVG